ncbi:MAG TPA: DedA family protein [Candidatus Nitrosotalea sp.]|nr:DedA family protein [Candidatus Nitrosotalea sp.]
MKRLASRRRAALLSVLGLVLVLLVFAYLEGDLPEEFIDARGLGLYLLRRFGAPGGVALLYVEESGVPLPIPGDVYVIYLGRHFAGQGGHLFLAWLAVIAVVVAGASNLYLISRRFGSRLLEHRLAAPLHLDQHRLAEAERWLKRWGPLTIIVGRHIPGLRIPITVVSGTLGVPYRQFAPAVAVSTAIWAGVWMFFGARFAPQLLRFLHSNRGFHLALVLVLVVAIAAAVVLVLRGQAEQKV